MRKLSRKQKIFCLEYVTNGGNATAAARTAGYKHENVVSAENLGKLSIQNRIAEIEAEFAAEAAKNGTIADPKELMEGYTRDIRFDPARLFDDDDAPRHVRDLPDDVRLALTGFDIDERSVDEKVIDRKYRYKFPNKNQVRDSLAKLLGLTNGNKDVVGAILEAIGMIQVNVQTNQYNMITSEKLRGAISDK